MKKSYCLLIVLMSLCCAFTAQFVHAQNVEYVGGYDNIQNVQKVFVSNNYAYVVVRYCIAIIDISSPDSPTLASIFDNCPYCYCSDVFISGNYAYATGWVHQPAFGDEGRLSIDNISDPANPVGVGRHGIGGPLFPKSVFVSGNYAYLASYDLDFRIIDISDPTNPTLAGGLDLPGITNEVFTSGNYAYGADGYGGLQIINISDPANPTLIGSLDTLGVAYGVFVSGDYAYVADGGFGLLIINISDPANPTLTGRLDTLGVAYGVFVSSNYAYVAEGNSGIQVVEVTDPTAPSFAGSYDTPGYANDVFVSGDYIFVADSSSLLILRFAPTGINEENRLPSEFSISQNYPNPFNAQTTIQYSLPKQSNVTIDIFDILGHKIGMLAEGEMPAGNNQAIWDASAQSSGIYFYRIKAGNKVETKKMVLMK
jgi:hypothetical protein